MENLEISTNLLLLVKRVKLGEGRRACAKEMIFPAVLGVHSGGIAKL